MEGNSYKPVQYLRKLTKCQRGMEMRGEGKGKIVRLFCILQVEADGINWPFHNLSCFLFLFHVSVCSHSLSLSPSSPSDCTGFCKKYPIRNYGWKRLVPVQWTKSTNRGEKHQELHKDRAIVLSFSFVYIGDAIYSVFFSDQNMVQQRKRPDEEKTKDSNWTLFKEASLRHSHMTSILGGRASHPLLHFHLAAELT